MGHVKQFTIYNKTRLELITAKEHLFGPNSKARLDPVFKKLLSSISQITEQDITSFASYLDSLTLADRQASNTTIVLNSVCALFFKFDIVYISCWNLLIVNICIDNIKD